MAIRFATRQDLPEILAIYAPYVENTNVSFEYTVPSLAEFTARFETITAQYPWLLYEEGGQVLGYAYGSAPFSRAAYQWCAAGSVYLAPQAQGRGVGKALYAYLWKLLKLQGYHKIYAIVTSDNENSLAFHKAIGYTQVAQLPRCGYKFGRWHGINWLEKVLNIDENTAKAPLCIESVVKNDRNFLKGLDNMTLF